MTPNRLRNTLEIKGRHFDTPSLRGAITAPLGMCWYVYIYVYMYIYRNLMGLFWRNFMYWISMGLLCGNSTRVSCEGTHSHYIDPPKTYVVFDFLWPTDCNLDTLFGGLHIAFIRFLCSFPILQSIDVKQTGWMGSGAKMPINTETTEVPGSKIGMRVVSFLGPKMFDPQTRSWKSARAGDPGIYIYIQIHIQLYICIRIWWYYMFFLGY